MGHPRGVRLFHAARGLRALRGDGGAGAVGERQELGDDDVRMVSGAVGEEAQLEGSG